MLQFVIIVLFIECVLGMSMNDVQQKAKLLPKRVISQSTTNENITVPNNFKNNYGPIFNSTNGNGDTYNLDLNNNNNLNNLNNTTITIINYFKCDDLFKKKSSKSLLKPTLLKRKKK